MASVYTNDLRLEEIGSGEQSGTWGDTTNTNLELIAEAFAFGTEAITTNADTHATTIADGATDPGRAMFLKYTGTLDSACTITIGPNTVSKLWFIENGTSGSQNIIIKQGSGATITIPPGDTKAIYSNGAGSGGAMVDAFASLSVVDLNVSGNLDVDGTANLDVVDIDGAVNMATTALVTGVLTTTAPAVFNGGFTSNGDTVTFASANSDDPIVIIKNTTNNAASAGLKFIKDKGAAGADGDDIGQIDYVSDNAAQEQTTFVSMLAEISTAADGAEGGKYSVRLATHDGEMQTGLLLQDGNAEDEIDVTIGSGTSSVTTIAGTLTTTGTLTATKLVSANGVLELDDNGSHNGIINSPASLRINIDSDNGATGESFQVGHNQTAIDANNILFQVSESGAAIHKVAAQGSTFAPNTPATWNALEIFQDRGVTNSGSGIAFRSQSGSKPAGIASVAGNTTGGVEELALMTVSGNVTKESMRLSAAGHVTKPFNPRFNAYRNGSDITLNSGANIVVYNVIYNSENVGGHYSTSNGRFTAPVAGLYFFSATIYMNAATNYNRISLRKNGSVMFYKIYPTWGNLAKTLEINASMYLTASQYVTVVTSPTASGQQMFGAHNHSEFAGYLIG